MQAARFRLIQSFFHDLASDAINLDVHLKGIDPSFSARHFEVHVTKMIFVTEDV